MYLCILTCITLQSGPSKYLNLDKTSTYKTRWQSDGQWHEFYSFSIPNEPKGRFTSRGGLYLESVMSRLFSKYCTEQGLSLSL